MGRWATASASSSSRTPTTSSAFLDAADGIDTGEESPEFPAQLRCHFERGATVRPALRKEIATHGWEVAASDAYPWLFAIGEDTVARPPTAAELTRFEPIVLGLATSPRQHHRFVDSLSLERFERPMLSVVGSRTSMRASKVDLR